jgi:hypothetical protein
VNVDDVQEWLEKDEQHEQTDRKVIALVNCNDNVGDDDSDTGTRLGLDKMERCVSSIGVRMLETTLA